MLKETHPYIKVFKTYLELLGAKPDVMLTLKVVRREAPEHHQHFNTKSINEIVEFLMREEHGKREIILHQSTTNLRFCPQNSSFE